MFLHDCIIPWEGREDKPWLCTELQFINKVAINTTD